MARPRPVRGLDPDRRLAPNARRILAVRIDEVHAFDEAVRDPARVAELHDLRIACKRLRYLLEIFAVAFPNDLGPFVEEVRDLQDLLGDIHDRDVQGPLLAEHLGRLRGPQGEAERPGVAALLSRCRSERDDLYARFLRRWERLADDAFRARLEGALGIR